MKKGKQFLSVLLTAALVSAALSTAAFAERNEPETELEPYFDTVVVLNGIEYRTTEAELDALLLSLGVETEYGTPENAEDVPDLPIPLAISTFKFVRKSGPTAVQRPDLKRRTTAFDYNGTSNVMEKTLTYTMKQDHTCNIAVTAVFKSAVTAEIGYAFTYSVSGSDSTTVKINPGEYSWVEYTPIMLKTEGEYWIMDTSLTGEVSRKEDVTLYTPRKDVSGKPDGIYSHKTGRTLPQLNSRYYA